MLSHKEPLSRDGKTSVLHMVTREHADGEKRSAEEQVAYWKKQVDERDRLLEAKERKIVDLKQIREFSTTPFHFWYSCACGQKAICSTRSRLNEKIHRKFPAIPPPRCVAVVGQTASSGQTIQNTRSSCDSMRMSPIYSSRTSKFRSPSIST